jgi:hypothetical protein
MEGQVVGGALLASEGLHPGLHDRAGARGTPLPEFERNVKIIGLSVDSVDSHRRWEGDIAEVTGHAVNFPMIGDPIATWRSSTT